jgi:hypothetical protein
VLDFFVDVAWMAQVYPDYILPPMDFFFEKLIPLDLKISRSESCAAFCGNS